MRKPDGKIVLLGDMNVGKTSLLQRYMERRFTDTVSTVGGAFYLKQWRSYNISIWDTAGREQFHGLGSMYCRGATAVILIYDVNHPQSLLELEDRFLGLTDTASTDCLFAIVGNKVDLVEEPAAEDQEKDGRGPGVAGRGGEAPKAPKQVQPEDAVALYRKILKYKMLDEKDVPAAEQMCFETSAKTGYNVDLLFETLFDLVVPVISRHRAQGPPQTVDITSYKTPRQTPSGCCA
ncbi:ras-related protein Rab-20 [Panthera pardus]|uniref:Ras-related protein Rab-20 n=1 Tax=Panthera pardus TaxID=9691 RepID=A0A9V1FBL7_PANPR|nr:ras-related protein Rab-20 [Panthera pardus]XP_042786149.1 ras-related protein Rab-20 [Panthera leo]XP_060492682.1 ras-related protein Rab-20 isoform X1 [Panthera onca]